MEDERGEMTTTRGLLLLPAITVGEMMEIDSSLGCDVYDGKSNVTGERVTLKFISKNSMLTEEIKNRLDIELACLTKLKHTNIQNLLEVIVQPQHIVRVYDYCGMSSGSGNIRQYLLQERNGIFALDWEQTQTVMLQLILAITHLHRNNIIHKDVTLDNIGLVVNGSLHHVKLMGFYCCEILPSSDHDLPAGSLTAGNCTLFIVHFLLYYYLLHTITYCTLLNVHYYRSSEHENIQQHPSNLLVHFIYFWRTAF